MATATKQADVEAYEEQRRAEEEAAYAGAFGDPAATRGPGDACDGWGLGPDGGPPPLDWRLRHPDDKDEWIAMGPPLACCLAEDGWHLALRCDDSQLGTARRLFGPFSELDEAKAQGAVVYHRSRKAKFRKICSGVHGQEHGPLALWLDGSLPREMQGKKWCVVRLAGDAPLVWGAEEPHVIRERVEAGELLAGPMKLSAAKKEARARIKAAEGGLGS